MGNLASLMVHGGRGDEVILDEGAHIYINEQGGMCALAGLTPKIVPAKNGLMDPAALEAAIRTDNIHYPVPKLLCLENTHNAGGGRVIPPDLFRRYCSIARSRNLAVHLDGARIFNAAAAAGVEVTEYTREVDSVQFCLSKGLSAPVGSMVAGSREFIAQARRARKVLGGGMRQAGVIAAAGIIALEQMTDRLKEDHDHAKLLAELVKDLDCFELLYRPVETNMVFLSTEKTGRDAYTVGRELLEQGLDVTVPGKQLIRMVTNRHVTEEDIRKAGSILHAYAESVSRR